MNKKSSKLLAAVAVFAMVACAFAVVIPAGDVNAAAVEKGDSYDLDAEDPGLPEGTTFSSGILTLNAGESYSKGFYYTGALTVKVDGTNTITVDRGNDTNKNLKFAAIYGSGGVTIKPTNATGDKLIINMTGSYAGEDVADKEYSFAIYTSGAAIQIGDNTGTDALEIDIDASVTDKYAMAVRAHSSQTISFYNVTGSIDGGNRAVYAANINFVSSTLILTGGEKAMTSGSSGTITLGNADGTGASTITADLGNATTNDAGQDDLFGVKAGTLTVYGGSKLVTDGVHIVSTITTEKGDNPATAETTETDFDLGVAGIITINEYTQNPNADIPKIIAGLYYEGSTIVDAKRVTAEPTDAGLYLMNNAEVFGAVKVTEGTSTTPSEDAVVVTDGSVEADTVKTGLDGVSEKLTLVIGTANGTLDETLVIPMAGSGDTKKTLEITTLGGKTFSGTIAIGDSTGAAGSNKITFDGFTGTLAIKEGSIKILGTQYTGDTTVEGDIIMEDDVKISGGTLTLIGTLVSNGHTITIEDGAGIELGDTKGLSIDGTVDIVGPTASGKKAILNGKVASGGISLNGNIDVDEGLEIATGSKAAIKAGAVVTTNDYSSGDSAVDKITNNGSITVYGNVSGTIIVNEGKIIIAEGAVYKNAKISGSGTIDNSAVTVEGVWSGTYYDGTYGAEQVITVTGDTTLQTNTATGITFEGTLIVNEGQTLTISEGSYLNLTGSLAKLINYGTIVVESCYDASKGGLDINGATVDNYGTITARAYEPDTTKVTISFTTGNVNNYGSIVIEEENVLKSAANVTNKSGGSIDILGIVNVTSTIKNEGAVNINGLATADLTINNIAAGAVVNVISINDSVIINDANLVLNSKGDTAKTTNTITIAPGTNTLVGGIVIASSVDVTKDDDDENVYTNVLSVSGIVEIDQVDTTLADATAVLTIGNTVTVIDSLVIGEGVTLTGATLHVDGAFTAQKDSTYGVTTTIADGMITIENGKELTGVVGAGYKVTTTGTGAATTYYYTNLADAVAGASAASVKTVKATGALEVEKDLTIPAGMTVTYSGAGMTIVEGVTVTVAATGVLNSGADTVTVEGVLYAEDKKTGVKGTAIVSQVKSEGEKDVRYTSLAAAIAAAGTTETTIKLNAETTLHSDLTIPANVIVDTNGENFIVSECKLTINGTLYWNGGDYKVVPNKDGTKGAVVVNGCIMSESSMTFDGLKFPAGAYYTEGTEYFITALSNIGAVIADADDQKVIVYGQVSAGDIALAGTADKPLNVIFRYSDLGIKDENAVSVGKITLDYATISFDANKVVSATIAGPTGSVEMKNIKSDALKFVASDSNEAKTFVVSGKALDAGTDKKYGLTVTGDVTFDGISITIAGGIEDYSMVIDGNAVFKGSNDVDTVLVNGTMTVANESSCALDGAVVMGTMAALETTVDGKAAGTIDIDGFLFVGLTQEDIAVDTDTTDTSAVATVTGDVDVTENTFVKSGAIVPEDYADLKGTTFNVEGAAWFTVYGTTTIVNDALKTFKNLPVKDVEFEGWYEDEEYKTLFDITKAGTTLTPGTPENLYAKIDYDVYRVGVIADAGIATVAIDGAILYNYGNTFETTSDLRAGQHTLTYTLKAGYEGTATMTIDGKAVSGYTFELSGDYSEALVIYLSGTSPASGKTESSGMSLTEILLIVLVVLIAIMAIVIAMRMMRS